MTDEQLSALLRLKRHETPPPGYFDRLLADVQRRQRSELLQRPLWKIALERFQTFFGEHSMSPLSYAGAVASVLVAGVITAGGLNGLSGRTGGGGAIARTGVATAPVAAAEPTPEPSRSLDLRLDRRSPVLAVEARRDPIPQHAPRYVIDARPVSYERPFSF
jgi:hypothetical protein